MELTPISEALVTSVRKFLEDQIDSLGTGWLGEESDSYDLLNEVLLQSTGKEFDE